ncbi:MAG: DUF58 domain-containing protein [Candidatus Eremiobacteraeota bacterium]|nr:DUF58 domain-containing protein [Candidatus Eremiobacteraeota bacterium]
MILATERLFLLLVLSIVLFGAGAFEAVFSAVAYGAAFLIVLLAACDFLLLPRKKEVAVERTITERMSIGEAQEIILTLYNRSGRSVMCTVHDNPPPQFISEPSPPLLRESVRAHHYKICLYRVTPTMRGAFAFGRIFLRVEGILGLLMRQTIINERLAVKVYPDLSAIRRSGAIDTAVFLKPFGMKKVRLPGEGTDFDHLRDYNSDDDIRWVDWNATARFARPISRTYEIERHQTIYLVLDAGRAMAQRVDESHTKLDYCLNASIALSQVALMRGDLVGIVAFADKIISSVPPESGKHHMSRILEATYGLQPRLAESNYEEVITFIKTRQRRRSLVIFFTDIQDSVFSQRFITFISLLRPTHLPLVISITNRELLRYAERVPRTTEEMYRVGASCELLFDREEVFSALAARGALVLDVPAQQIHMEAVKKYLDIKMRNRL